MRRAIFLATTLALISSFAQANFVSDQQREDSKTFPKFFMKRFETWFAHDYAKSAKAFTMSEKDFIAAFIDSLTAFGERGADGFARSFDYTMSIKNGAQINGPYRFFDTENRPAIREKALAIVKQRAPKFDLKTLDSKKLGLGFQRPGVDFEILVWEADVQKSPFLKFASKIDKKLLAERASGRVILAIKNSQITDVEILQTGIKTDERCPPVLRSTQVDRVLNSDGSAHWLWHVSQYEEQALDHKGREVADQVRSKLNIVPGTIEWRSAKDYRFSYP